MNLCVQIQMWKNSCQPRLLYEPGEKTFWGRTAFLEGWMGDTARGVGRSQSCLSRDIPVMEIGLCLCELGLRCSTIFPSYLNCHQNSSLIVWHFIAIDSLACNFLLPHSPLPGFILSNSSLLITLLQPCIHLFPLLLFSSFPTMWISRIPRCAFLPRHYPWPSNWMHLLFLPTMSKGFLAQQTASLHLAPKKIFR